MKKILIVCYNHLKADPRVQRQIEALKNDFQICTLAMDDCGIPNIPNEIIYELPTRNLIRKMMRLLQFLFRFYETYYWDSFRKKLANNLQKESYSIIIANDIATLPLALKIANGKIPVLFDSHDFHPNEFDDNIWWRLKDKPYINFLCKKYIPKATKFITSSESISEEYFNYIKIKPEVIDNAREYYEITPSEIKEVIKLVHHGAAIEGRRLENMIEVAKILGSGYELYFMLTNKNSDYYNYLVSTASITNNVKFIDAVPYDQIVKTLNHFDIGIYHLDETNINNANLLPNKIFEFIQARLCCVVTPTKELKKIVGVNQLGIVSSDFTIQTMAREIDQLTPSEIMNYKLNCHLNAEKLSSKPNLIKLREMVIKLSN